MLKTDEAGRCWMTVSRYHDIVRTSYGNAMITYAEIQYEEETVNTDIL